ncbi:hypothetical protein HYQ46_001870 [Verticillium longisporum]|nr:hypothetical protein HYQ46_001870 [Verticillium longisporum]
MARFQIQGRHGHVLAGRVSIGSEQKTPQRAPQLPLPRNPRSTPSNSDLISPPLASKATSHQYNMVQRLQPILAFREATTTDVPNLLPLIRTAYRGNQGWTNESAYLNDKRISPADLESKINAPDGLVLITHDAATGELVACCELQHRPAGDGKPSTGYFGLFAVDPNRQGGGLGRQVLARAEAHAKEKWSVEKMEMFVLWMRDELIDWYVRRGYKRTGERGDFPYEHVFEGQALRDDLYFIILRKDLTSFNGVAAA